MSARLCSEGLVPRLQARFKNRYAGRSAEYQGPRIHRVDSLPNRGNRVEFHSVDLDLSRARSNITCMLANASKGQPTPANAFVWSERRAKVQSAEEKQGGAGERNSRVIDLDLTRTATP